jgi:hypothetical protein
MALGDGNTSGGVDSYGQSSPLSTFGEITGISSCAVTPAPTPTPTPVPVTGSLDVGDFINAFGNGPDVFRQHYSVNTPVIGWPATQTDPATHFIRTDTSVPGVWTLEAVLPDGEPSGFCISNPAGGDPADQGGPTGLELRGCNGSVFQRFSIDTEGGLTYLVSAVDGGIVDPGGRGVQLVASPVPVSWAGGSVYHWVSLLDLP